ncbi:unnamed protein product [Danaus chrysippus]|uniref:(African queen) hypothetical protein n=1 Tax=Danaus chrysippus TaxID=151541 RepID=A0A8J2R818_9NEOP|nr:unnamed protein product [Danaus chrysippus]
MGAFHRLVRCTVGNGGCKPRGAGFSSSSAAPVVTHPALKTLYCERAKPYLRHLFPHLSRHVSPGGCEFSSLNRYKPPRNPENPLSDGRSTKDVKRWRHDFLRRPPGRVNRACISHFLKYLPGSRKIIFLTRSAPPGHSQRSASAKSLLSFTQTSFGLRDSEFQIL